MRTVGLVVAARNFGPAGATPVGRGSGVLGVYRHIAIEPTMAQRDDDRRQWCTNRSLVGLIRALIDGEQQLLARDPSLRRSCVQAHLHVENSVDGCAHARTHTLSWFTGCLHSSQLWCCHAAETAPSRLREASLVHILTRLIALPHTAALQLDASQSEHVNFAQLNDAFNTACSELESLRAHNVSPTRSPSPVPCSLLLAFLALPPHALGCSQRLVDRWGPRSTAAFASACLSARQTETPMPPTHRRWVDR